MYQNASGPNNSGVPYNRENCSVAMATGTLKNNIPMSTIVPVLPDRPELSDRDLPKFTVVGVKEEPSAGGFNHMSEPRVTASLEELRVCEICDDRATGLHYGILTCEG